MPFKSYVKKGKKPHTGVFKVETRGWKEIRDARPDTCVCELRVYSKKDGLITTLPGEFFLHDDHQWYNVTVISKPFRCLGQLYQFRVKDNLPPVTVSLIKDQIERQKPPEMRLDAKRKQQMEREQRF